VVHQLLATNIPFCASQVFTHILYDLATYPSYVSALREEVEAVVDTEGMTKEATDKMYKLDSFIRESLRLRGTGDSMFSTTNISPRFT
jgi:cytochrome P450